MSSFRPFAVSALLLIGACNRNPEPSSRDQPASSANPTPTRDNGPIPSALLAPSPPAALASANEVAALTWSDPPGWTRVPSQSGMRLATYKIPHAGGDAEDAEVTVFHFPGGGGVDANFERWMGQFQNLDRAKTRRNDHTRGNLNVHVLEVDTGTFASSMGPMGTAQNATPKPNYGLLGAVIESPSGNYFFKLIGPAKTVKSSRGAFLALLDGLNHP